MTSYPAAYVDIWPADGGEFSLSSNNGMVLAVDTNKDIWMSNSGTFSILLAPGGPMGPDSSPQWVDVIAPMSLCVIGLQRNILYYPRAQIVMVGVVTAIEQEVAWQTGVGVRRVCRVSGQDFSYFFQQSSAYCDTLMLYSQVGLIGSQGNLAMHGIISGSPDKIASQFFNLIVAGTSGIMASTKLQYNGSTVKLSDTLETNFQPFPNVPISIPTAWNFLGLDGTWFDNFHSILPFPWYEVGVLTAGQGQYGQGTAPSTFSIGDTPMFAPANPVFLARPMPLPRLANPSSPTLDTKDWDNLPVAIPDNNGLSIIRQSLRRELGGVRNFYIVNPVILNAQFGGSNQSPSPFIYTYGAWIDPSSIERYGYKPRIDNLCWFADPSGQQAVQNAQNVNNFDTAVGYIGLQPVAFHEPEPLMMNGSVSINMRPDILPGTRFRCTPEKDSRTWDFYIRGVNHSYSFGAPCLTTLTLARGLPTDVYNDHATLLGLMTGKGGIVDGDYTLIAGNKGVQPFNIKTSATELAQISSVFATPGAK